MSVPLDRLYNFLHDICNHRDLIIYRFFPHGSRKIEDLVLLEYCNQIVEQGHSMIMTNKTFLFFHDQEPLNFDLYQLKGNIKMPKMPLLNSELNDRLNKIIERVKPEMNLRWAAGIYTWKFPILLAHSEKRSNELEKYSNIDFVGVYWWCHALIARDWFRYAKHDLLLNKKDQKPKDFLIYNRAWSGTREYRLKFTELLIDHELVDNCLSWFSPIDEQHYTNHVFKNPAITIANHQLENYFTPPEVNSAASADYNVYDYQRTQIEIVLETLFDDNRLHLTEKALRPIACGHPFILTATHGSLEYLRSYGFETFSPWIDETYDTIQDPAQRLETIVQEMKRIANLSEGDKIILYAGIKDIALRNKKLFFSDAWQEQIVKEFLVNFHAAIKQINSSYDYSHPSHLLGDFL